MIVLLAGSLALAESLVIRHKPRLILSARFELPPGSLRPLPVNHWDDHGASRPRSTSVSVSGQSRGMFAVGFDFDSSDDPSTWDQDLIQNAQYATMNKLNPVAVPPAEPAMIAGRPALELQLPPDPTTPTAPWWLIRITESGGTGIAICFSGTGLLTDADKVYFDSYCKNGVAITLAPPR